MQRIVNPATEHLRKRLQANRSFSDIDFKLPPVAAVEGGWVGNTLKFFFRKRPYYARVEDNQVRVVRPGGLRHERPVGNPVPIDSKNIANDIAMVIDSMAHE